MTFYKFIIIQFSFTEPKHRIIIVVVIIIILNIIIDIRLINSLNK